VQRVALGLTFLACAGLIQAQNPNVAFRVDLVPTYISSKGSDNRVRWYDALGRFSTVGFGINLETGHYVLVTERMARIRNDRDREQLDELYVEDPGLWRLGRQYLPFGAQGIYREVGNAIRIDSEKFAKHLVASIAVVDNGPGRTRGAIGRVGTRQAGLSLGWGERFGQSSTVLAVVRDVEQPLAGIGSRVLLGADVRLPAGALDVIAEHLLMRRGNSAKDVSRDVTDLRVSSQQNSAAKFVLGWSRDWTRKSDFYRIESELVVVKNVALKSLVRFEGGAWKDLSIGARIRF
jgi:hypothetical protein